MRRGCLDLRFRLRGRQAGRRRGGPDAELQFGLCGTVELLVDGGILTVEKDIGASTVGVAFQSERLVRRDA